MGLNPTCNVVLSAYVQTLIQVKARQLCRKPGFRRSDHDDVAQDMTLHLLTQAHRYDPARGTLPTFADRVVTSAMKMILRDRRRLKRAAGYMAVSLEARVAGAEGHQIPLGQTLLAQDGRRHIDQPTRDPLADLASADALAHALGSLPPELADICRRLTSGTVASVARDLGVSRRQIYNALESIRSHLEGTEFGNSEPSRTPRASAA